LQLDIQPRLVEGISCRLPAEVGPAGVFQIWIRAEVCDIRKP
jgi:hypothetical protein